MPTERYWDLSVGRELAYGFSIDAGWQFIQRGQEDANGPIAVLRYRAEF